MLGSVGIPYLLVYEQDVRNDRSSDSGSLHHYASECDALTRWDFHGKGLSTYASVFFKLPFFTVEEHTRAAAEPRLTRIQEELYHTSKLTPPLANHPIATQPPK
ncbi:hypothetical protein F4823DRAFT_616767 [Ustulina deusta]|nr:hypothetical protein F4823DRAFT_616767 [Ustulina deusta]